jgi:hypothetical protein
MRRLIIFFGLLFFLPATASAAALSPWVQGVLDRADLGITMARGLSTTNCNDETVIQEIMNNQSMVRDFILTTRDLAVESQFLRERTVCFESDRRLLEDKLTEIRKALNDAIGGCYISAAKALQDNYEFTATAYASLLRAGVDPLYKDNRLRFKYAFHDNDLWNTASDPVFDDRSTAPLCPFTTDYAPHSYGYIPSPDDPTFIDPDEIRSYGCDQSVLPSLTDSVRDEASALSSFIDFSQTFSRDLFTLLAPILPSLPGNSGETFTVPSAVPPHAVQSGCLKPVSPTEDVRSQTDAERILFEGIFVAFPNYFDQENLGGDPAASTLTFNPTTEGTLPEGLLLRSTYDFFLTAPNITILEREFGSRRGDNGDTRPLPGSLLSEAPTTYFFSLLFGADMPSSLRLVSSNIEREMGMFDSWDRDAMGRTIEMQQPFSTAVKTLVEVTDKFLPRQYIPSVTYFLQRSCVDGPCQKTLDTVMRRTLNPYCRPFVSGQFNDDDAFEKCICTPKYANESYCMGELDVDSQSPVNLECGEPTPAGTR